MTPRKRYRARILLLLFAVWGGLTGLSRSALADAQTDRRVLVGLRIFPAVVAADEALMAKVADDGHLLLLVLYGDDRRKAEELAERLRAVGTIRDLPIRVQISTYATLNARNGPIAGIFLTQWAPEAVNQVVAFGRRTRTVTFSPFKGDVKQGIVAGLSISDRILPLVNRDALKASAITLKPFFLDVAKHYERSEDD